MLVPLVHMQSQHEVYRFFCDQCDYKAATKGNMNVHKQAKHEGIQYSCDQFIKLDCDQWECKLKHKGIVYSCDQWDYKASHRHAFRIHKQLIHEDIKLWTSGLGLGRGRLELKLHEEESKYSEAKSRSICFPPSATSMIRSSSTWLTFLANFAHLNVVIVSSVSNT